MRMTKKSQRKILEWSKLKWCFYEVSLLGVCGEIHLLVLPQKINRAWLKTTKLYKIYKT